MKTVIDHAISIPASSRIIWAQISKIDNLPNWHLDCQRVSYLTSLRAGRGTRWRQTTARGSDIVIEITAWYEGLGYEYVVVDGVPYQNDNKGRIRIQETPDGTIVQWTFTYEVHGLIGSVRNSLTLRQQLDRIVVDSLRNLYTYIRNLSGTDEFGASKSLMRDAPDVEQRSQYKPRHPSRAENIDNHQENGDAAVREANHTPHEAAADARVTPTEKQPEAQTAPPDEIFRRPDIEEPPLTDEDTRPNPAVQDVEQTAEVDSEPTGTTAAEKTTDKKTAAGEPTTQTAHKPSAQQQPNQQEGETPREEPQADPRRESGAFPSVTDVTEREPDTADSRESVKTDTQETPSPPAEASTTDDRPAEAPARAEEPEQEAAADTDSRESEAAPKIPQPAPLSDDIDTARISVFEVFGLQKPSETQEMRAVLPADLERVQLPANLRDTQEAHTTGPASAGPKRVGLRLRQRQHLVKLRRPDSG